MSLTRPKDAAIDAARAGFRVFPLSPGSKRPYPGTNGVKDATTDGAAIAGWPEDCNYGIACGDGLCVVDVDVKPGHPGRESLATLHGLPGTYTVRTPSGGWHMYYRCPAGTRSRNAALPGIDFRAEGYYVVGPGSVLAEGGEYTVCTDAEITDLPPEIIKQLLNVQPDSTKRTKSNTDPDWVEELSQGTGPGTHDDSMTQLAGYYVSRRLSEAQVIDIIENTYGRRAWNVDGEGRRIYGVIKRVDIERVVRSIGKAEARKQDTRTTDAPFILLGYDHGEYYYLSRASGQLVRLRSADHNRSGLLRVADARYWDANYSTKEGVSWTWAQSALMEAQHRVGLYDPDRIRGRGAWYDERDGAVIHTGDTVVIRGQRVAVRDVPAGRYIYELALPLELTLATPIGTAEGIRLMRLFNALSWSLGDNEARLALGWCVCAVVCGALGWRPHLWLTGPSGTGKSYIVSQIIRPLLGNMALDVIGTTTEAGVRQTLGSDALPVIFDEAEGEGKYGPSRIQSVLELMRLASTEGEGKLVKGSTDGAAKAYKIRSCFMLSSINVSAFQTADRNRITLVNTRINPQLSQEERNQQFANIERTVRELLTDDFCAGFRARCVAMIPVIRKNARYLAVAASNEIGSRRLGDQVGTLLAGAAALLSDTVLTPEEAIELVKSQDLSEQKSMETSSDEHGLLGTLKQNIIEARGAFGMVRRTVWKLIALVHGDQADQDVNERDAVDALARIGIRCIEDGLAIACSHVALKHMLRETNWKDWTRTLLRVTGAESRTVRIEGAPARCVVVPWVEVLK